MMLMLGTLLRLSKARIASVQRSVPLLKTKLNTCWSTISYNHQAVHLYAHRFVGIVGQHKRFGVENISVSWHDGIFLASCAMDDVIRFWNISYLYDVEVDGTLKGHKKHDKGFNLESSKRRNHCDFFFGYPQKDGIR
ncbi:WD repeat-containing protein 55-like [Palaemon carinicauda]|uniref:WD repeat-containing protein 55-like n=1 Tax=Palaemon carinicauda TaxID=392227 RepID=UPI0035B5B68C